MTPAHTLAAYRSELEELGDRVTVALCAENHRPAITRQTIAARVEGWDAALAAPPSRWTT